MALGSYLPERAGALVAAGAFRDEPAAIAAVRALRDVGLRREDVTVLARDPARARRVAAEAGAWTPKPPRFSLPFRSGLPATVRGRYGRALDDGRIVVIAVSDGQPAATLATILERVAKADAVTTWWQEPASIFPPAEEGGPL